MLRTALCDYAKAGGIDGALLADCILLIEDTSRETAREFMRQNRYVDVLIPRGGAGLIRTVVENSTIPVIETEPEIAMCMWMKARILIWQ